MKVNDLSEKIHSSKNTGKCEIDLGEKVVTFPVSDSVKDAVFDAVMQFYFEHDCFSGEGLMQSDSPLLDAPNLIAAIADDILKLDAQYKDEI